MKKMLIILLAGIFIAGCSTNEEEGNSDGKENGDNQVEEESGQSDGGEEQEDVYQIGETANTTI
ncbi:hypothetical protein GCM10007063_34950 [Lentibacillus kapialis]|uniref:Uncharacterized protein n=1 Tax=Lentibacillus kapialis TaxID=340214 RepID=A0A917Q362_9BACI|nr:hypothetical protein [Lentibacillus kapialis]GGK09475.1 hypothetical protein GCM10007063_34950 [Lentibacillus kapialis]